MTSPLERMIDAACKPYPMITLRCPKCQKEKMVHREAIDPPTATVCVYPCPDCHGPEGEETSYLDAAGNTIDWNKEMGPK